MDQKNRFSKENTLAQYNGVFQLLRNSLFSPADPKDTFSGNEDWAFVYRELLNQSVVALPFFWLRENHIPDPSLQEKWLNICSGQQARWIQIMFAQSQLIELLENNDIPCVILKGSAAAMAYPQPSLRMLGDVDFLVHQADFEKASKVLESSGYSLAREKNPGKHHDEYTKDGVLFELHHRLGIVRPDDQDLMNLFEEGISNRTWNEVEGFAFPSLPVGLNGLVLLFHINQHLRSGLGLRQIIDWMMYLQKNNNLEEILPLLRKTGVEKLALTVTAMCQKYLGLKTIVADSSDYPCDELMELIMKNGNFGKKSGTEGKTEFVFLDMSNPIRAVKRLQEGGLIQWKAAKTHRVLRPFAWIYQIGSILHRLAQEEMTPRKMLQLRKKGIERRELLRKLGLQVERSI